jgi:hypothetical protein
MSMKELETVLLRGTTPDLEALAGWEFRGTNTPAWAKLAGIKHFRKGFYKDAHGDVFGYNRNPRGGDAPRYGFYRVDIVDATARDNAYLHAVLLDYGRGGNKVYDPTRGLRDYLVQVEDDVFLGKAYYALGPIRLATSFFVLERDTRN